MPFSSKKFRFGIFIIFATAALLVILAILTSQKLFKSKDDYYIKYKNISVSGLEVGSPVAYLGVKIGSVDDIYIDPDDMTQVVVEIGINEDTPIKTNSYADINIIGITGMKMIEIRGGTKEAPLLPPGSRIKAGSSLTDTITEKSEVIMKNLDTLLFHLNAFTKPENLEKFSRMAQNTAVAFNTVSNLILDNQQELKSIIKSTSKFASKLDTIQVQPVMTKLSQLMSRSNDILSRIDRNVSQSNLSLSKSLQDLQISLENIKQASQLISNDPSVMIRGAKPGKIPDKRLED